MKWPAPGYTTCSYDRPCAASSRVSSTGPLVRSTGIVAAAATSGVRPGSNAIPSRTGAPSAMSLSSSGVTTVGTYGSGAPPHVQLVP
ncbi:hypothetical protein Vau01_097960 [Virgisporangium aurantiacum]|uniref:Uncharacterized protein n=1 Tax=Virgisporangium aurantiacum TaxID=175570 RepID=A0A8J3ZI17_9ACTN|nr:hypothetical protein Vau01_097960 [Virgisporangium aurantiacum]